MIRRTLKTVFTEFQATDRIWCSNCQDELSPVHEQPRARSLQCKGTLIVRISGGYNMFLDDEIYSILCKRCATKLSNEWSCLFRTDDE